MIDTHAHLFYLKKPLKDSVAAARKAGVSHVINVGVDIASSFKALDQATQYPDFLSATIGVHPCDQEGTVDCNQLKQDAKNHSFVAIGEIGLDYHHMVTPKKQQICLFESQLQIAQDLKLPAIIHSRQSDNDMATIVKNFPKVKKVLHCFSSLKVELVCQLIFLSLRM